MSQSLIRQLTLGLFYPVNQNVKSHVSGKEEEGLFKGD